MNESVAGDHGGELQKSAGGYGAPLRITEVYHPSVGDLIEGWAVLGQLGVVSSEADLCLCQRNGEEAILKLYRHGITCPLADNGRLQGLHHPGLVPTLACGVHRGRSFEISPRCNGSLQDVLECGGKLTPDAARGLLAQVAGGIAFLHSQGIQHRDIKLSNILVAPGQAGAGPGTPTYWLSDFGRSEETTLTRLTMSLSTVAYAAPEAVNGVYSLSSDYWSLGIVLLESLLGHHPLADRDGKSMQFAIVSGHIPIAEELPEAWKLLLGGLLVTDHTRRWGEAEIAEWLAQSEQPEAPVRRRRPKERAVLAAIGVAVAGLGLFVAEDLIAILNESAVGVLILAAAIGFGLIAFRLARQLLRAYRAKR